MLLRQRGTNVEQWHLVSFWGDTLKGTRNGACEDFDSRKALEKGIQELLKDHPDATWKVIQGVEIVRGGSN
jgi:hypothetical protein